MTITPPTAARFIDTHAHLESDQFDGRQNQMIQTALDAGVQKMIAIGCTWGSSQKSLYLAKQHENVFAAVGIHPNYCSTATDHDWERILAMLDLPEVVALGETGLDRYWDYTPFELQQEYFDRHIRTSQETGLPFIVHMRQCAQDILEMLQAARQRGPLRGVMHSFTGDAAMASNCLDLGMYISFAGMVTFKKNDALREVAAMIPANRILLETDCPYLSPHPYRSKRPNHPAMIFHTAQCVADVRGVSLAEIGMQSTQNAYDLFTRLGGNNDNTKSKASGE
jgi:TatD DNase family protein